MITVTDRDSLRLSPGGTARFEGAQHDSDVSFFLVDSAPGAGPDLHVHPYTETWVVLAGQVQIEADGRMLRADPGAIVTATAGTAHRFVNCGPDRLEMVCIHASPLIVQEFLDEDQASIEPAGAVR